MLDRIQVQAGQAWPAWRGLAGTTWTAQGLLEALGPWIQGLRDPAGTPGSGPWDPGSRVILARPLARIRPVPSSF